MDMIKGLLGDFGYLVQGTVVVLLVIIVLSTLGKILKANSHNVVGKKFRNQLVMFAASFAGVLTIILGLPLDSNTRGQLLALIGILLSAAIALSGSTILSNAMAGIMLKSVRNFRSGDFIRVGEYFGRVTERGLFHTEIQTPDRDLTTLPNLLLATTAVTVIRQSGTIISATVSLGYDAAHTRVEKLLVQAATDVGLSEPFVQVLELGDFSVNYRIAGLLTETKKLITFRSRLRAAVLDALHTAGVEIVSPDFTNARVFQPGDRFIPATTHSAPDSPADSAPVDVIFDKAEDAESLSRLRKKYTEREEELRSCRKQLKETDSTAEKETLAARIATLEKMLPALETAITRAQEREDTEED